MSEVTWIKVAVATFEDEKMKLIQAMPEGDAITVIWFRMLMQAGKCNAGGYLQMSNGRPLTCQMLATLFDRTTQIMEFALRTFIEFGMVEDTDQGFYITNWEKHQNVDGMERIRKQTRERVARHRQRKQQLLEAPKSESNVTCNVTVTRGNGTDLDQDQDLDQEREIERERELAIQQIVKAYEETCGPLRGHPSQLMNLLDYMDQGVELELIVHAIHKSSHADNPAKYADKILANLLRKGTKTLDELINGSENGGKNKPGQARGEAQGTGSIEIDIDERVRRRNAVRLSGMQGRGGSDDLPF